MLAFSPFCYSLSLPPTYVLQRLCQLVVLVLCGQDSVLSEFSLFLFAAFWVQEFPCDGFQKAFWVFSDAQVIYLVSDKGWDYLSVWWAVHKYPYDWRTKKPTIFRATEQWFASVEGFRQDALDAINQVQWVPPQVCFFLLWYWWRDIGFWISVKVWYLGYGGLLLCISGLGMSYCVLEIEHLICKLEFSLGWEADNSNDCKPLWLVHLKTTELGCPHTCFL